MGGGYRLAAALWEAQTWGRTMSAPLRQLTPEEQADHLRTIQMTLDNFSLAAHLCSLLSKHHGSLVQAAVQFTVNGKSLYQLVGTNCGFVTTPVLQMAILDTRRSLEFFGITRDRHTDTLKPIQTRHADDLGIEHFGLSRISVQELLGVTGKIELQLAKVHEWSNKQLAHFTVAPTIVEFGWLHATSLGLIRAFVFLLFDALNLPRPVIQGCAPPE
jgi:hypothetical protein